MVYDLEDVKEKGQGQDSITKAMNLEEMESMTPRSTIIQVCYLTSLSKTRHSPEQLSDGWYLQYMVGMTEINDQDQNSNNDMDRAQMDALRPTPRGIQEL